MKSTLRAPIVSAIVLLSSLGATLAAPPVLAQQRGDARQHAVAAPFIERFVLRDAGGFVPGREVAFRLVGASGAQAWLAIPGVPRPLAMTETRPGVYEASYVVRRRDDPGALAASTATLRSHGQQVSARVVLRDDERGPGPRWGRDERGPQITDLTPSHGDRVSERGWTRVSARINDGGSGIDPSSAVLRIDGRNVTAQARLEGDELRYAEDLQPGRHTAEVVVRDRSGNASRRSWTFDVFPGERHGYSGYEGGYAQRR